jgi:hypothetical protein
MVVVPTAVVRVLPPEVMVENSVEVVMGELLPAPPVAEPVAEPVAAALAKAVGEGGEESVFCSSLSWPECLPALQ